MSWGETEYIDRIEILDTGEFFLGLEGEGKPDYQFVYREASGVYWEPILKGFKSTALKEWRPSEWFSHMVDIVRIGVGVELVLCDSIQWRGISEEEKALIESHADIATDQAF
jgi:hypothetical protein